jgi:hypothetical protein
MKPDTAADTQASIVLAGNKTTKSEALFQPEHSALFIHFAPIPRPTKV